MLGWKVLYLHFPGLHSAVGGKYNEERSHPVSKHEYGTRKDNTSHHLDIDGVNVRLETLLIVDEGEVQHALENIEVPNFTGLV